jgi:hypothetical protein
MDLVALITACALSVEPKIMHALVWEQSGGEPWSFSVPGESLPRVLPTAKDALREARSARPGGGRIRVGLTGLSVDPRSVTAVLFTPCANITLAARQITKLAERCKADAKPDPVYCAIAAYRGTWERPNIGFADVVRAAVQRGNAPNFDMPKDVYFDAGDVASETSAPTPKVARPHGAPASDDDHARGWSSGLFPVKPLRPHAVSDGTHNGIRAAEEPSRPNTAVATETPSKVPTDSLFVPRSVERTP